MRQRGTPVAHPTERVVPIASQFRKDEFRTTKSKSFKKITISLLAVVSILVIFVVIKHMGWIGSYRTKTFLFVRDTLPDGSQLERDESVFDLMRRLKEKELNVIYAYRFTRQDMFQNKDNALDNMNIRVVGPLEPLGSRGPVVEPITHDFLNLVNLDEIDVVVFSQRYQYWPTEGSAVDIYAPLIRKRSQARIVAFSAGNHHLHQKYGGSLSADTNVRQAERNDLLLADYILCGTGEDLNRTREWIPTGNVGLWPISMSFSNVGVVKGYNDRKNVLFVANKLPVDTLNIKWFVREVWPIIRKENGNIELHVAGIFEENQSVESIFHDSDVGDLHSFGVRYLDEDHTEELDSQYRVFVASYKYGTGMNSETARAMSNGLPVVTVSTSFGTEGIIVSESDAQIFAQHVVELYTNKQQWEQISDFSQISVRKLFDHSIRDGLFEDFVGKMKYWVPDGFLPKRILILHHGIPLPQFRESDKRLIQILRAFHSEGHDLSFAGWKQTPDHTVDDTNDIVALSRDVLTAVEVAKCTNDGCEYERTLSLQKIVCQRPYDAFIATYFNDQDYWKVVNDFVTSFRALSPQTKLVLMTETISYDEWQQSGDSIHETIDYFPPTSPSTSETLKTFDSFVTASWEDDDVIRKMVSDTVPVNILHLISDEIPDSEALPSYLLRNGFAIIASCDEAGVTALDWYFGNVHSLIRKQLSDKSATVKILGTVGQQKCYSRSEYNIEMDEGIEWVGTVPDLMSELSSIRVLLSPNQQGTGICYKQLMTFESGVPLVTTTAGAPSLHLENEECLCGLVSDDAKAFADNAVKLHDNPKDWKMAAQATVPHLIKYFSGNALARDIQKLTSGFGHLDNLGNMCEEQ